MKLIQKIPYIQVKRPNKIINTNIYIHYLSIFIYLYTSIYLCICYNNATIPLPQRHILKFQEIYSSVLSKFLVQISEDFVNEN